jgi:uncharacterized membrane protein YadS
MDGRQPQRILAIGMILLGIAIMAQRYLQRHSGLPEDTADLASGLLLGIALGTLLLGLWRLRRRRGRDD